MRRWWTRVGIWCLVVLACLHALIAYKSIDAAQSPTFGVDADIEWLSFTTDVLLILLLWQLVLVRVQHTWRQLSFPGPYVDSFMGLRLVLMMQFGLPLLVSHFVFVFARGLAVEAAV